MAKNRLKDDVEGICTKQLAERFKKYEKVYSNCEGFFNQKQLSEIISQEVDLELFSTLIRQKVNHDEMETMELKIDKLNEKVKHISVLTSSITGSLIPFKKKNNTFMDKEESHKMVKEL